MDLFPVPSVWQITRNWVAWDNRKLATPPVVQWLRLHASTAGSTLSIPGQGTQIPLAPAKKRKEEKKMKKKPEKKFFLNNRKLFFQGAGGQERKVKVLAKLHSVWEVSLLASSNLQWLPVFPGLRLHHCPLGGHNAFSSSLCEQISLCLPLTNTSDWIYSPPRKFRIISSQNPSLSHTYKDYFLPHKAV